MFVSWFRKQIRGDLAVVNLNSDVKKIDGCGGMLGGKLNCGVELVAKLKEAL